MQDNPWAQKYGIAPAAPQQAPQQPQTPGVIMGRPKAPNPYDMQQDDIANQRAAEDQRLRQESAARDAAKFATEQAERDEKLRVTTGAKDKTAAVLRDNLARIDRIIKDADDNGGWGETGTSGAIMRAIGPSGTAGYSLASELETLKGNNAFTALIGLAEQGIKLTPISNAEVKLAADSIANLDPNADHETFMRTLRSLRDRYNQTLADIEGPSVSTPEAAAQMTQGMAGVFTPQGTPTAPQGGGVPGATMDNITFDMDTGQGAFGSQIQADRLNPQQQAALDAFLKANAGNPNFGPEQLTAFYQSVGIQGGAMPGDDSFYQAVRSGEDFGTQPNYAAADEQAKRIAMEASLAEAPEGTDLSTVGMEKGLLLNMTDELRGGIGGVRSMLGGEGFMSGYQSERDIERALQERSREQNGIVPELTGSLLTPVGVFGTARTARQFANQGAALGGTAGFGEGQGVGGSATNALLGATLGAAVGGTISQAPRAINALTQSAPVQRATGAVRNALRPPSPAGAQDLVDAGQRQGVPVRYGDVDPQRLAQQRGVARASEEGNRIIRQADAEDVEGMTNAVNRLGQDGTPAADKFEAGARAQDVLGRQSSRTRDEAQRLYRVAEEASDGVSIAPRAAVNTLNDEITRLRGEGADDALINYLTRQTETLRRPEGWTPMQLHAYRSGLRKNIRTAGLPVEAAELPLIRAIESASTDLQQALAGNNRALSAVQRADRIWSERTQFRRQVGDKLFGKDRSYSPDQTARALDNMAKTDTQRFARYMDELEPQEAADLRATYAADIGRDGQGNFSMARFLTQTHGKQATLTPRAMRAIFGEDGTRAIADLRAIATAKQAAASETNYSRTGNVVSSGLKGLRALLFAGLGGAAAGPAGAVVAPAASGWFSRLGERRAARLITNPDFTRWLRTAPNSADPAVINRHFDRLNKIASREQTFLMDAKAIQSFMAEQFSKGTGRAAADENTSDNGRK